MKKTLTFVISFAVLCLPGKSWAQQNRTPDSTPSTLANTQLKAKLREQINSHYKIYFFGEKSHTFTIDKKKHITVTKQCGDQLETSKCQAVQKLKQVNMNDITTEDLDGGKNPGAVLCKKSLNAQVIFGKDRDGNVTTFCSFQDGTMVSSDTLIVWGNKNAQKDKR
ncbi:MAG: hypothetical protein HYV97_18405 [Bdellovibrio sp.]|nr:hypothetical protein [Bdellovibrio sp.]